jgi:DNA-binding NarL/FixJ family response regulator
MKKKKQTVNEEDMSICVVLIEDDTTIREGYAYLIDSLPEYKVVGQFSSYENAEPSLDSLLPDVVLLDVELPGINGVEAVPKIKKLLPETHILILTVYENEQTIFKALTNGAAGYLTKNMPTEKVTDAIREVMEGGGPMSAGIARLVIKSFQRNTNSPLTKRETEVLEGIANGKSRSKIAKDLFLDLETIKSHIKNIYHKLNVNSKEEALKVARDSKLI